MSKARQTITPRAVTPQPKPAQREVVINVNKNVLFSVTLVVGALVMLLGGFLVGQILFRPPTAAQPPAAPAASNNASGLPQALQQPGVAGAPSGVQVKPANLDPNAIHPNLDGYAPVPASVTPIKNGEPRILVEGIDDKATLNMGNIKSGEKREYNFTFKNVGSGDLIVNQMYTSCGCTLANFAGREVTDAPFEPSIIIKPGQGFPLIITYDSVAMEDKGHIDKFVQVFTNDPTAKDIQQDYRETRFRLTGEVVE